MVEDTEREPMNSRTPQEIWEAILGELQVQVSKPNYRTWFEKTSGISHQDNRFVIGVPNAFVAEYLDKNQRSLIEKALIGFTSPDVKVSFQVNGHKHDPAQAQGAAPETHPVAKASSSMLNPHYIFESFVEGKSNSFARAAALAVAQNPGHSYNPLFIYGKAGLGKTHLLHAIGHLALEKNAPLLCVSAEQFTNEFVNTIQGRKTEEFRNKYRNAGMLLIDDIQFINGKEQTEESFFHTFNELHNNGRQIVITSDRLPKEMPELEERLRSRLEWGLIVGIKPPDFETRLAILQAKAKQRGVNFLPDVLEFIAQQIQLNVRKLEGSLNRVIAYARLLQASPTVELAAEAMEDLASKEPESDAIVPVSLIKTVADNFQLSPEDLKGRRKDKEAILARRVAMYLMRQETNYSLAQIGQELGGRDAAAVTNACKKTAEEIKTTPFIQRKISKIKEQLDDPVKGSRH